MNCKNYLNQYRKMIALRNLADHTLKSYTTYMSAYLYYAFDVLKKNPVDASWDDLRAFVLWLKKQRHLSDRTINSVISQLRFFTLYILHKPCLITFPCMDYNLSY